MFWTMVSMFIYAIGAGIGFCLCLAILPKVLKRPVLGILNFFFDYKAHN
jgi:hypothetical protein